jgi:hypothetical protein
MNCQRCHGLMVQDRAYDLLDTHIHCDVWRCICCGNMFDVQILTNQGKWRSRIHQLKAIHQSHERTAA